MTLFDPLIVLFSLAGFGNFKCGFGSDGGGFPFLPIIWIGGDYSNSDLPSRKRGFE